jgi:tRNA(Ile2) C34 agmatinyltransferase TiaS
MNGHPNMAVFSGKDFPVCPTCGGHDLYWNSTYSTPLGLYKAFRCQDCGAIGRSTKKQYKLGTATVQA